MAKSIWCKRLLKELKTVSPHIRIKRLKHGFYRVYYQNAYIHEFYEEMPVLGYTFEDYDPRLESQQYFEELEDHYDTVRNLKNYKEGYYDAKATLRRRLYMMQNDAEFNATARRAYQQIVVK